MRPIHKVFFNGHPGYPVVVCHMEGSGKWPHDRVAIRHLKAAFHLSLGELLTKEHSYTCRPCPTHLDVWKVRPAARQKNQKTKKYF